MDNPLDPKRFCIGLTYVRAAEGSQRAYEFRRPVAAHLGRIKRVSRQFALDLYFAEIRWFAGPRMKPSHAVGLFEYQHVRNKPIGVVRPSRHESRIIDRAMILVIGWLGHKHGQRPEPVYGLFHGLDKILHSVIVYGILEHFPLKPEHGGGAFQLLNSFETRNIRTVLGAEMEHEAAGAQKGKAPQRFVVDVRRQHQGVMIHYHSDIVFEDPENNIRVQISRVLTESRVPQRA